MNKDDFKAVKERKAPRKIVGRYGISFLDDFLCGLSIDDFILIGAPSGVGKSQLAYQIATINSKNLRTHLFALEAGKDEPILRMMYKILVREYFKDPQRKPIKDLRYRTWVDNLIDLDKYMDIAEKEIAETTPKLTIHYKKTNYTIQTFAQEVSKIKNDCDLIVLDHVDYFDFNKGENENEGMKHIMGILREINQSLVMPIIVISHVRKQSNIKQIIPSKDDFHGSSDKHKQAETCIMLSPDNDNQDFAKGDFGTFIIIPKGRKGSTGNIVARMIYNNRVDRYKKDYELCRIKNWGTEVELLSNEQIPGWAENAKKEHYSSPEF